MRPARFLMAAALLAAIATGSGATAAHAARSEDPVVTWDASSLSLEYGEYWTFSASAANAIGPSGPWTAAVTMSGVPSGYTPAFGAFQTDPNTVYAYVNPALTGRPLPVGSYSATLTITGETGGGTHGPAGPATLTITPAVLVMTLQVTADPSNPSNAIISSDLTGAFRSSFFTASYPEGPLPPVGSWHFTVTDENGDVVHDVEIDRTETQDVMGASSYWSGVAPGSYTVKATFTASGASASNFAITAPAPVTYTAAPAPGATSTATPAPPAPPPADGQSGLTLPLWVPLVAGIVSVGLLALAVVQIVRLRRRMGAAAPAEPAAGGAV